MLGNGFMARNDPTDTGGLFIGRRPERRACTTRRSPIRARVRGSASTARIAVFVLVVETLVCLTLWGPQPVAWLWVGSQANYHSGSVTLGIAIAFAGMIASLMLTLVLAVRLDAIWKVVRRAGGIDQREGALPRIFAITAIVAALAFGFWFLILEGPAPSLAPQ